MNKHTNHVVIIGAGLTGLTLAFYLRRKGVDCLVLEKDGRPGGVVHTGRQDGFVYETGPNTGVISNFETTELFEQLAPHCRMEVANPEAKRRLIWKGGAWHALPSGLMAAIKTPLFTRSDKLRILLEPFRKKGKDPMETVATLVRRRLGESFLDYAVDPFVSGIFAGDPERLVTRYALPKLYRLEQKYGSFIGGAIGKKVTDRTPQPSKEVFSAVDGLDTLTNALQKIIGENRILLNVSDLSVHPKNTESGYKVSFMQGGLRRETACEVVVSTLGSHRLTQVFPFLDKEKVARLTSLHYATLVQVVLGFKKWQGMPLNAFGGLVPSVEKRRLLGVLFPSAFLSGRAPEGGALLNAFLGGERNPHYYKLPDKEIINIVKEETVEMMQLKTFEPDLLKIHRYSHAIPQYGTDSFKRLEAIMDLQIQHPGLFLAGNIKEGVGMADRIAQARRLSELIEQW